MRTTQANDALRHRARHVSLIADNVGNALMDQSEIDKAAIMSVLRAETEAWLRRDFDALAQHWVQSPQARRMTAFAALGMQVEEGWETIGANTRTRMERYTQPMDIESHVRWERVNIVLGGDMAWVSYDQVGEKTDDGFEMTGVQHELKVFHRTDGGWKIGCLVILQRTFDHATVPLISLDANARVLWMSTQARDRIADYPGLLISSGVLKPRQRDREAAFKDAVAWATRELEYHVPACDAKHQARVVHLGEDDEAAPIFCWVFLEDNNVMVSFDDADMISRRIEAAKEIYRLSPAQVQLAQRIIDGQDLATASEILGVSVTTLRTQLRRMFDKTGARTQTALVRTLLATESPLM